MVALILAAGAGTRLMPLTRQTPKCLIDVAGKALLDREIDILLGRGVDNIMIATGFGHEKVRRHVERTWSEGNIQLVFNEKYASTNYIYSMWLAGRVISDDVLLLHGDLVFDPSLLDKLLDGASENGVLVRRTGELPEKDFKAIVNEDRVKRISVDADGADARFCAPFYKLSRGAFVAWCDRMTDFIENGRTGCYAEEALNKILDDVFLPPIYYDDEFCMEIDTLDDLKIAGEYLAAD
ncbi:MAG: phosphocholine cytidylyltransferase family protein [Planctomycetes bacterium]|nr:phosphocholine cytidylyltransferase family protein [Planctomycetota bacterium]